MDLQTVKTQYGPRWAWARTGAIILFLVTGLLLAASLTAGRQTQSVETPLKVGTSVSALLHFPSAG